MTTLTTPRRFGALLAVLTAVCAIPVALTSVRAVDIVLGLPLALLLPGAALVLALDPWHRQVRGPERALWSFGSSIGLVILGGLLLNLIGGLTRAHWLILMAVVVAVCVIGAWFRSAAPGPGADADGTTTTQGPAPGLLRSLSLRNLGLLVAAVLVVTGALYLSQRTNAESTQEHFVQAWVLPRPTTNLYSTMAQVGITNDEGHHEVLLVRLVVGSSSARTWTVGLKNGQTWAHTVAHNPGQRVRATVAVASRPSVVLDRVDLVTPK
jgi:uncharacterized membrane protein